MIRKSGLAANHPLLTLLFLAATTGFSALSLFSQPVLQCSTAGTNVTVYDNSPTPPVDYNSSPGAVRFGGSLSGWSATLMDAVATTTYSGIPVIDLNGQARGRGVLTNLFSEQYSASLRPS